MDLAEAANAIVARLHDCDVPDGTSVYLFGSLVDSAAPVNDVDVLVVYKEGTDLARIKYAIIYTDLPVPIDLICMTYEEEHHYRFLNAVGHRRVTV